VGRILALQEPCGILFPFPETTNNLITYIHQLSLRGTVRTTPTVRLIARSAAITRKTLPRRAILEPSPLDRKEHMAVCKRVLGYQGVEAGLWILRCYYASYHSRGELQILKSCPADARTLQSGSCTPASN
jgi:hypothetical protein